jgi:uncharacterized protein (TIGR00730 family)
VISVFGGSRIERGSDEYEQARRLGRLLAEAGFALCNGGYSGTMEAASRGAKEADGRTIGVTVDLFAATPPNDWIDEIENTASLLVRLDKLTLLGDAYVVLRGGVGTLLELALVWNLVLLGASVAKPIVLVGAAWEAVLGALRRELTLREPELSLVTHAPHVDAAVEHLRRWRSAQAELDAAPDRPAAG